MKVREIAEFLEGELRGDGEIDISSVADLANANFGEIAFLSKPESGIISGASCVIVRKGDESNFACTISVPDPKLAFAKIAAALHPVNSRLSEIHPSAVVAANAKIGNDVFIGAFVCVGENSTIGDGTQLRAGAKVGDNVKIGDRSVLHPNVFIEDGCSIGNDVIVHAGTVIGADGFGFVKDENGDHIKFPQIGTVVIEDNVEIGANSCIDRASLGETRIGEGTKIDNLVQIAHNVRIGKRCIIASQTGISGSSVIEDDVVIAGQVGIGDHVQIRAGAILGGQAGILPGKILRKGVWWGTPAQSLDDFKRQHTYMKRIVEIKKDVEELKSKLKDETKMSEE